MTQTVNIRYGGHTFPVTLDDETGKWYREDVARYNYDRILVHHLLDRCQPLITMRKDTYVRIHGRFAVNPFDYTQPELVINSDPHSTIVVSGDGFLEMMDLAEEDGDIENVNIEVFKVYELSTDAVVAARRALFITQRRRLIEMDIKAYHDLFDHLDYAQKH